MAERKNSLAKLEAIARYNEKNYDTFSVRLKKGVKEQIQATGMSLNGFVTEAVNKYLEESEKGGN